MHCLQILNKTVTDQEVSEMFESILNNEHFKGKCNLDISEATINFKEKEVAEEANRFLKDKMEMSGRRIKTDVFEWNN